MFNFSEHSKYEEKEMLDIIGLKNIEDLFSMIPEDILCKSLDIQKPINEIFLEKEVRNIAEKNSNCLEYTSFLGGGVYQHYVPSVVDYLASISSFTTAYTPYQPEMNQGLLTVLYEFQKYISLLTGLPVSAASSYDGATALADASIMAHRILKHNSIHISETVFQHNIKVVDNYLKIKNISSNKIPFLDKIGTMNLNYLENLLKKNDKNIVVIQSPNAFGIIEPIEEISSICKKYDALMILHYNPLLSGLFYPPGNYGIDIVSCELQPLGLHMNSGGPFIGSISTIEKYKKYLPGRLTGIVKDLKGNKALALISQEREQQVSRGNANSSICTNQALMALRVCVMLGYIGDQGLKEIARINTKKAHYLANKINLIPSCTIANSGPFFNEFVITLPYEYARIEKAMYEKKTFPGIGRNNNSLLNNNQILIAVTEIKSKGELDSYFDNLNKLVNC